MFQRLSEKLSAGREPVITVELSPPKGTDVTSLLKFAIRLKERVDAINIPDCQLSMLKMSSLAACKLIEDQCGIETIWQLTCRDRNLIALQADLLGGYALGLRNVLALTGDPVQVGDQRDHAKQVFHLEAVRLLDLLKAMNAGHDATGSPLKQGTQFTVGAAINPFRLTNRAQLLRLQQKMERGVQFFQTQPVYHVEPVTRLQEILAECAEQVGCSVPKLLIGIIPPKNANAARRMNQDISGVNIPDSLIALLEASADPCRESMHYCSELVQTLLPAVDGFHFMPVGTAAKAAHLLDACFPNRIPQSETIPTHV